MATLPLIRAARALRSLIPAPVLARRDPPALPPGFEEPALLHTYRWVVEPIPYMLEARARFGSVFTMPLAGFKPMVLFSDPEAIKEIFTGPTEALLAGKGNALFEPVLGSESVLLLDGPRHMAQRRLLLPPFHGKRMRAYGAAMHELTELSMARWPRGRPFPIHPKMQSITLDVILRTVFGVEGSEATRALRRDLETVMEMANNPLLLMPWAQVDLGPVSPWGRTKARLAEVDARLYAILADRRRALAEESARGAAPREDILSLLLAARHEDGSPMSDKELRDELMTLLLAGHETTATALAWCFAFLLENPEALARAYEELEAVFGSGPFDPERVEELPWIEAVAKESLRRMPVVPLVVRELERPMRIGGVDLPAGVRATPCIYLTHHDPALWPDPERFDPRRFLDARARPYAFYPFGGGIRRCIGMAFALYEMRVILATVLRRLRIAPSPGHELKVRRRGIVLAPSEGMPVVTHDRA